MRTTALPLTLAFVCLPVFAQTRRPAPPINTITYNAEAAIKQAMENLGNEKKIYERDLEALQRVRNADAALTDPMQPNNAIQKAIDELAAADPLVSDLFVKNGIIKARQQVEEARRSPASADFGRLRASLRTDALGPTIRLVARNGARLQEETLAWIRIQELISMHLKALAEMTSASLRAAQ